MLDESTLLGKIVSFAMIGLLGWLAFTTYNLSIEQAKISTEMQGMKELIVQSQQNFVPRGELSVMFDTLKNDVVRLENRIEELEKANGTE